MKRTLPKWFPPETMRHYRQRKRRELQAAIAAFHIVWRGAIAAPNGRPVGGATSSANVCVLHGLKELKRAWSQKEWGK